MGTVGYLILAIGLMVVLLVVFIVTFVWYRRTPPPKGCEKLPSEENCSKCGLGQGCSMNIYAKKEGPKK